MFQIQVDTPFEQDDENRIQRLFGAIDQASYQRYWGFAYYLCNNAKLADDVLQDALCHAMTRVSTLRDDTKFDAWLHTIIKHKAYAHLRVRQPRALILDVTSLLQAKTHALEEVVVRKELLQRTVGLICAYDATTRRILALKTQYAMTFQEIAALLNMSVNSVKTRYYRTLTEIRAHLEAEYHDESES